MGHVINKNSHPAYVRHPSTGESIPIGEGAVVEADGALLDAMLSTPGLQSASNADVKKSAADSAERASGGDSSQTPAGAITRALVQARAAASALLAATNQIVIGDDQAPHGPPSGTVTTKQALAATDPAAFAENEAIVVGKVDGSDLTAEQLAAGATPASSADVHNAQVTAQENVGDVAAALAALHAETAAVRQEIDADEDADEDEPETPEDTPAAQDEAPEPKSTETYEGDEWTGAKLDDELDERELPKSGNKAAKAARLRESDAANDATL